MYRFVVLLGTAAVVTATNLGIGYGGISGGYGGYGVGAGTGAEAGLGAGAGLGSTVGGYSISSSSSGAVAPVLAAAVPAVVAAPALSVPTATSSQSRIDIINPRPIVTQSVSSVPVNVVSGYSVGYGGTVLAGGGAGGAGGYGGYGRYGY